MKTIHQGQPRLHCVFLASLSYIQGLDSDIQRATNSTNQGNKAKQVKKKKKEETAHDCMSRFTDSCNV